MEKNKTVRPRLDQIRRNKKLSCRREVALVIEYFVKSLKVIKGHSK